MDTLPQNGQPPKKGNKGQKRDKEDPKGHIADSPHPDQEVRYIVEDNRIWGHIMRTSCNTDTDACGSCLLSWNVSRVLLLSAHRHLLYLTLRYDVRQGVRCDWTAPVM